MSVIFFHDGYELFLSRHCLHLACFRLLLSLMALRTCFSSQARMSPFIPCLMALHVWMYLRLSQAGTPLVNTHLFSHSIFVLANNLSGFLPWCLPATRRAALCMTFVMVSTVVSRWSHGMASSTLNLFHDSALNSTSCLYSLWVSIYLATISI